MNRGRRLAKLNLHITERCKARVDSSALTAKGVVMKCQNPEMPAQPLTRIVLAAVLAAPLSVPQAASAQLSSGFGMTTGTPDDPPESAEECSPLRPGAEDGLRLTPTGVLTLEFHSVCLHRWAHGEDLAEVTLQVSAYLHSPGNVERLLHVPSWTISERAVGVHVRRSRSRSARVEVDRLAPAFPPAVIDMDGTGAAVDDALEVTVTETVTGRDITLRVPVQEERTHVGLTDSFLFIKRLRPSRHVPADVDIRAVNFEATPGITHRLQFSLGSPSRRRWLSIGLGYNVSFIDWGGEDKGIGAGPIVTFMDDALQLTFGWALNARAARMYYGVGFSVVGLR